MLKGIIARVVCLVLAWTSVFPAYAAIPVHQAVPTDSASLQKDYPNARVIHVTPEEYPALREKLLRQGYLPSGLQPVSQYQIAQTEPPVPAAVPPQEGASLPPPPSAEDECKERENDGGESSFHSAIDITHDMVPDNNSGNSDSAAVLFIIVGTVVLVIWTLYVVRYLVDSSMGMTTCGRWSELIYSSSAIGSRSNQHARFNGLRYMHGFNDSGTDVGISAELGNADILLTEVSSLRLQGLYWLIGPMLRWNMNPGGGTPNYFQMEFVAGSTEHPEMGIIAVAKMGFNFGVDKNMRWGLNFGAMNINLHENQGIITNRSQYYFLYGLEFGYRF